MEETANWNKKKTENRRKERRKNLDLFPTTIIRYLNYLKVFKRIFKLLDVVPFLLEDILDYFTTSTIKINFFYIQCYSLFYAETKLNA